MFYKNKKIFNILIILISILITNINISFAKNKFNLPKNKIKYFTLKNNYLVNFINKDYPYNIKSKLIKINNYDLNTQDNSKLIDKHLQKITYLNKIKNLYLLEKHKKSLYITYIKNNIKYIKKITLYEKSHCINITLYIKNTSQKNKIINFINTTKFVINKDLNKYKLAYLNNKNKYQEFTLKNIKNKKIQSKWIALIKNNFINTWIFKENKKLNKKNFSIKNKKNIIYIKNNIKNINILPNKTEKIKIKFYYGLKLYNLLENINPYLTNTIKYQPLNIISQNIFKFINFINKYIHNWGYSLIIFSIILKIFFLPLNIMQNNILRKIQKIQFKIQNLKQFKKTNINKKIISIYRKNNFNIINLLFPTIIQILTFISLYKILSKLIELKNINFLWIKDLSTYDHYYILPIIMVLSSYDSQKNKKNSIELNILTSFILLLCSIWVPSSITIYCIINNIINILFNKIKNKNDKF